MYRKITITNNRQITRVAKWLELKVLVSKSLENESLKGYSEIL